MPQLQEAIETTNPRPSRQHLPVVRRPVAPATIEDDDTDDDAGFYFFPNYKMIFGLIGAFVIALIALIGGGEAFFVHRGASHDNAPPTIDYSYISAMTVAAVDVEAHSRQSQANLSATEAAVAVDANIDTAQGDAIITSARGTAAAVEIAMVLDAHNAEVTIESHEATVEAQLQADQIAQASADVRRVKLSGIGDQAIIGANWIVIVLSICACILIIAFTAQIAAGISVPRLFSDSDKANVWVGLAGAVSGVADASRGLFQSQAPAQPPEAVPLPKPSRFPLAPIPDEMLEDGFSIDYGEFVVEAETIEEESAPPVRQQAVIKPSPPQAVVWRDSADGKKSYRIARNDYSLLEQLAFRMMATGGGIDPNVRFSRNGLGMTQKDFEHLRDDLLAPNGWAGKENRSSFLTEEGVLFITALIDFMLKQNIVDGEIEIEN